MTEALQEALAWSLEALEEGSHTVEECLERYPRHRTTLQALLQTAQYVQQSPKVTPTLQFKQHARQRLINRLEPRQDTNVTFLERIRTTVRGRYRPTSVRRRFAMSWLLVTTILLSIFAGGGVGVAFAADGAVPGDALYGVDLGVENIRFFFTFDQESKTQLALEFASERLDELQEIIGEGASGEAIGQILEAYRLKLEMAEQAMNQAMAGEAEQAGETLRLVVQQQLMLQNQILEQVRNQLSTQNMAQFQEAVQLMEATRTQLEQMLSAGGQGDPSNDAPAGPSDNAPGGPSDDGQGGMDDPGGNSDTSPGGPADSPSGEGQQEGTQGSDAGPFEKENEALRACLEQVEDAVVQGNTGALAEAAARCGESLEGLMATITAANQGDTQQAATMAGMLKETLDEFVPKLNSLLQNAPDSAGTHINQVLTACQNGQEEIDRMFGFGHHGPGDHETATPPGTQSGKDN
ncbi:MAG: DUF5667 domain-containing protein [Anaerolineales bacterium]